jgi:CRISPR type III-B/RAMP module-associated protein Cmr5
MGTDTQDAFQQDIAPEQTLEQMRMRFALAAVQHSMEQLKPKKDQKDQKDQKPKQIKEFVVRCHSLPAQILQNGLNQALAFCLSRKGDQADAYGALVQHLDNWLTGRGPLLASLKLAQPVAVFRLAAGETRPLLALMLEQDIDHYMLATREALALLHHLKRFASAFAPQDAPKDTTEATETTTAAEASHVSGL